MKTNQNLSDYTHPLICATVQKLTAGKTTEREKLESLYYYARDEIRFGFPQNGDLTSASDTIRLGMGQCNTKGTLFLALCRAIGIPARIHFSLIRKDIQRGLFTGLAYRLIPELLSHCWVEIQFNGKWRRIDSYINDQDFYLAGKQELKKKDWHMGYSIASSSGNSSSALNLEEEAFVQMAAVTEDQGVWDDPSEYYATALYRNRPNAIKLLIYRLIIGKINRKVAQMRRG
jgi:hypothetical protein